MSRPEVLPPGLERILDSSILRIRICSKLPFVSPSRDAFPARDGFICIRRYYRNSRDRFSRPSHISLVLPPLAEGKTLLFSKGKINNSGTLASRVCAYARKRAFSASADSAESSCREFGNRACHWLRVDPLRPLVKKNGLIIRWIIYPLGSFMAKNAAR